MNDPKAIHYIIYAQYLNSTTSYISKILYSRCYKSCAVKMVLLNFFVVLLLVLHVNLSFTKNIYQKSSIDDRELPKSICKITNDVTNLTTDTQDILIGNFGGKAWSSTVNDILQCLHKTTAVVVTDFITKITEQSLRKVSVVVAIGFDPKNHVSDS